MGARILEKHITISSFVPGPDQSVSIESNEFKKLISAVQYIDKTSGFEKKIQDKEVDIRTWAYRSIVAKRDIGPGEIISSNDIQTKRPGLGIPSNQYKKVIGKKALNLIKENTLISWKDLDEE